MNDNAPLLERAFSLDVREDSYPVTAQGEVPSFIDGRYYVNGPSRFGQGDVRYRHWLDGDGMVCSLQFGGGQVQFTNRFVRSRKFKEESEQGRCLYRTFGTAFKDDQLKHGLGLESPANVSVYPFSGTLLAFGEQGLPYELDPQTLETRGEYTFGGRLNAISPLSAHPHIDLETGEMFNFGISFAARRPCVQVYRIGPDGEIIYRKRVSIEQPCSMHDFNLSPSYVLIYLSPYTLDMEVLTGQSGTIMDALRWEPEQGSRLLVLSRETGEKLADIAVGQRYCLHHINAFEQNGHLVVDLIELDRPVYDQYQVLPDLFTDAPRARPVRLIVDPEKWQVSERREIDYTVSQDFPAIDPRRALRSYEDLWLLGISATGRPGRKFFDQLAHLSWDRPGAHDVYQAPPGQYLGGAPVFVADPADETNGVVICQRFDAESCKGEFLLFDSQAVADGPICTLPLRNPVPLLFHSWFEPTRS